MVDVGDSGGFYFYGDCVGEVMLDFCQFDGIVNKCVVVNNKVVYCVQIQFFDVGFCGGDQFIIGFKFGWIVW